MVYTIPATSEPEAKAKISSIHLICRILKKNLAHHGFSGESCGF